MRGAMVAVLAVLASAGSAAELYPAVGALELVLGQQEQDAILLPMEDTSRNETLKAATKVWGEPADAGVAHECGAGAMAFTDFDNGLRLYFQRGVFVGWTTMFDSGPSLRNGFGIGSQVGEVLSFAGPVEIEETSLGYEFWGDNFYGLASEPSPDGIVDFYWSGTNCLFR